MVLADVFDNRDWVLRTYHALAGSSRVEIPPDELASQLRGFFLKIQDELAQEGVWWGIDELVSYCLQPTVLAAVKMLASIRGNADWPEFVDTITSLERGKVQP